MQERRHECVRGALCKVRVAIASANMCRPMRHAIRPFESFIAVLPRMASNSLQFFLRSSLTMGSLFVGATVVHYALKPDLVRLLRRASPSCAALISDGACCCREQTVPELRLPGEQPPATSSNSVDGFVAASTFGGARPGFAFKVGAAGLGYYPDPKQQQPSE